MISRLARSLALFVAAFTVTAGVAFAHGPSHGSPPPHGHGHDCSPDHHRAAIEATMAAYVEVINQRDTSQFSTVFHDDYRLVSTAGSFDGLPAFTGVMSALYAAMPDIEYTVDELLVDGENATLRYTYTGTHLGDFLGIPATGNTITCSGLEIDRIEDGKLLETRNFTNYYCLLDGMNAL